MGHDRLYTTIVVPTDEAASYCTKGNTQADVNGPGTYNPELFRLKIPQVSPSSLWSMHSGILKQAFSPSFLCGVNRV